MHTNEHSHDPSAINSMDSPLSRWRSTPVIAWPYSCGRKMLVIHSVSQSDQPRRRSDNGKQHLLFVLHISDMYVF